MRKTAILFAATVLCNTAMAAQVKPGMLGLHFNAPTINNKNNVSNPVIGEIVYDSSDSQFWGYIHDSGNNVDKWLAFNMGSASTSVPAGTVITFAGATCPTGYVPADGKSYPQSGTYNGLYQAILTANGDGSTGGIGAAGCPSGSGCFNVPDYRGRFLRGVDGGAGRDPDRLSRTAMATGGNSQDAVGSVQGQATRKNGLALSDPGHSHTLTAVTTPTWAPAGGSIQVANNTFGTSPYSGTSSTSNVSLSNGDSETRPTNAYVNYCVKY